MSESRVSLTKAVATLSAGPALDYLTVCQSAGVTPGAFVRVTWKADGASFSGGKASANYARQAGSWTESTGKARLALDYANTADEVGRDDIGPLPATGAEWVAFPWVYGRTMPDGEIRTYARLYVLERDVRHIVKRYYLEGVEVGRDEYEACLVPSARSTYRRPVKDGEPVPVPKKLAHLRTIRAKHRRGWRCGSGQRLAPAAARATRANPCEGWRALLLQAAPGRSRPLQAAPGRSRPLQAYALECRPLQADTPRGGPVSALLALRSRVALVPLHKGGPEGKGGHHGPSHRAHNRLDSGRVRAANRAAGFHDV